MARPGDPRAKGPLARTFQKAFGDLLIATGQMADEVSDGKLLSASGHGVQGRRDARSYTDPGTTENNR